MIFYDYKCNACKHVFEKHLPSEDRHIPETEPCPKCGADEVRIAIGIPHLTDPAQIGIRKPDREFRDLLGKIKKDHAGGGNIDRYT